MSERISCAIVALAMLCGPLHAGAAQTDIPGPPGSVAFGAVVVPLPNGNFVVVDLPPLPTLGIGTVYLYSAEGNMISALTGSAVGDEVGEGGIFIVGDSNFVVFSPDWQNVGAVTWVDGKQGLTGAVSSSNSLTGTGIGAFDYATGDTLFSSVYVLSNGNYVVTNPTWNDRRGAAAWASGATGISGAMSEENSLVGSTAGDYVGQLITVLGNGNYVVGSRHWNGARGAATLGNGVSGTVAVVSATNSLVGTSVNDRVGDEVVALANGNYVVRTYTWNGARGAATWGDGTKGVVGEISSANSLVGSNQGDYVSSAGITALSNGNYVVASESWNADRGAATWGDGTVGTTGTISAGNSLVGSQAGDQMASSVMALANGNYVVSTSAWNNWRGSATWGSGTAGVTGEVSAENSLVGSTPMDRVASDYGAMPLANGNYVVTSFAWNGGFGAATWGNGAVGTVGVVSAENSLVGTPENVGIGRVVVPLANGNYVVEGTFSTAFRGCATWGSGVSGISGAVSADNSLIGSPITGMNEFNVLPLANGDYVATDTWANNQGAITWGDGEHGTVGTISVANSFVGTSTNDLVGYGGINVTEDGHYVVRSPNWNGGRGAVTLASDEFPLIGTVQPWNSVTGTAANGGSQMFPYYDTVHHRLLVGRPADNVVSILTLDYTIFADGFE